MVIRSVYGQVLTGIFLCVLRNSVPFCPNNMKENHEIDEIKFELESRGFTFISYEKHKSSLHGEELKFSRNGKIFSFTLCLDDDTASYRHGLDWDEKGNIGFQPDRWVLNNTHRDFVKCLKRRLNRYLKLHEPPPPKFIRRPKYYGHYGSQGDKGNTN